MIAPQTNSTVTPAVDVNALPAKICQVAMENDYFPGALGLLDDSSAKG